MKFRKNLSSQACLFWSLGLAAGLLLVVLTWWLINRLSEE